jgi:hypothetical protein
MTKKIGDVIEEALENPEFISVKMRAFARPIAGHDSSVQRQGFVLFWHARAIGNGEITFVQEGDGPLVCDSERMNKNFVKKALAALVDTISSENFK